MEPLRHVFERVGSALLQPPLHQRNLCPRQIVRQHVERDATVGFSKGRTQASFNFQRVLVADSPQNQQAILALKNLIQQCPGVFKMPVCSGQAASAGGEFRE